MTRLLLPFALCFVISSCDFLPIAPPKSPSESLANTTWALTAYGDTDSTLTDVDTNPDLHDGPYVVHFLEEGNPHQSEEAGMEGEVSCNSFEGAYEIENAKLTISQIVTTLLSCMNSPEVQYDGGHFTEGLRKAERYRRTETRLRIYYHSGSEKRVLVLEREEAEDN